MDKQIVTNLYNIVLLRKLKKNWLLMPATTWMTLKIIPVKGVKQESLMFTMANVGEKGWYTYNFYQTDASTNDYLC